MMSSTRNTSRTSRRTALPAIIAIVLLGVITAFAHAQLLHSKPDDKAKLENTPARVDLWFNELLDEGFNTIEVYPVEELNSETHTNLADRPPRVDPQDKTHLSATLHPLRPGKYIVDYRVLSRDGHTAPGRITFIVLEKK